MSVNPKLARRRVETHARVERVALTARQIAFGLAHRAEPLAQRADLVGDLEHAPVDRQRGDLPLALGVFEPQIGELLLGEKVFLSRLAPQRQRLRVDLGQIPQAGELLAQTVQPIQFGRHAQGALAPGALPLDAVMLGVERRAAGFGFARRRFRRREVVSADDRAARMFFGLLGTGDKAR